MENSEPISRDAAIALLMLEYELPEEQARQVIADHIHAWATAVNEARVREWGERTRLFNTASFIHRVNATLEELTAPLLRGRKL